MIVVTLADTVKLKELKTFSYYFIQMQMLFMSTLSKGCFDSENELLSLKVFVELEELYGRENLYVIWTVVLKRSVLVWWLMA